MDDHAKVKIKGIREGLLITVRDDDWTDAKAALQEQIKEQSEFLQGGRFDFSCFHPPYQVLHGFCQQIHAVKKIGQVKGDQAFIILSHF